MLTIRRCDWNNRLSGYGLMQAKLLLIAAEVLSQQLQAQFSSLQPDQHSQSEIGQSFLGIVTYKFMYFTLVQETNFVFGRMYIDIDAFWIDSRNSK